MSHHGAPADTPAPLSWRTAAWLADAGLASPIALAAAWLPWQRFRTAHAELEAFLLDAMTAAFDAGATDPVSILFRLRDDAAAWSQIYGLGEQMAGAMLLGVAAVAGVFALWAIGFERSAWQATPGKRWLGLRVKVLGGGAVGVRHAALRWLGGVASAMLLHAGHAMIGFRNDCRALHDLLAGTQVVFTASPAPTRLPLSAQLLIAAPVIAVLLLSAWVSWLFAQLALLLVG